MSEISAGPWRSLQWEWRTRDRDYWRLGSLAIGRMAAHHTSTLSHHPHCISLRSSRNTSRGCMKSPMLRRLSSSPGGSVRLLCLQNNDRLRAWALELPQALKCQRLKGKRLVGIRVGPRRWACDNIRAAQTKAVLRSIRGERSECLMQMCTLLKCFWARDEKKHQTEEL